MKACIDCDEEKALDEFYRNGRYYTPRCKGCHKAYMNDKRSGDNWHRYYEQNRDNILKACSRYYERKKKQPMKLSHLAIVVGFLLMLSCAEQEQPVNVYHVRLLQTDGTYTLASYRVPKDAHLFMSADKDSSYCLKYYTAGHWEPIRLQAAIKDFEILEVR